VTPGERRRALLRAPQLVWNLLCRGQYDFTYDQIPISVRRMSPAKRLNLVCAGLNVAHRRLRPWSLPLHLQLELTNYCNLRCAVCPTGTGELTRRPQAMSPALAERVLEDVGSSLLTLSLWGWGESLLHPELETILRTVARYPIATLLSTNGQNLGRERVLQALTRHPPVFLIVAIDGLTDATTASLREGAKLAPALEAVRILADHKARTGQRRPILHMRFIATRNNRQELPQLADFAAAHGFDQLALRSLSTVGTPAANAAFQHLSLDPENLDIEEGGGRPIAHDHICQQPFWFPSVYADGTVVACEQDCNAKVPMGRVGEGVSFSDVWFGRRSRDVRRAVRDTSHGLPCCHNCPACQRSITDTSFQMTWTNPTVQTPTVIGGRT